MQRPWPLSASVACSKRTFHYTNVVTIGDDKFLSIFFFILEQIPFMTLKISKRKDYARLVCLRHWSPTSLLCRDMSRNLQNALMNWNMSCKANATQTIRLSPVPPFQSLSAQDSKPRHWNTTSTMSWLFAVLAKVPKIRRDFHPSIAAED